MAKAIIRIAVAPLSIMKRTTETKITQNHIFSGNFFTNTLRLKSPGIWQYYILGESWRQMEESA